MIKTILLRPSPVVHVAPAAPDFPCPSCGKETTKGARKNYRWCDKCHRSWKNEEFATATEWALLVEPKHPFDISHWDNISWDKAIKASYNITWDDAWMDGNRLFEKTQEAARKARERLEKKISESLWDATAIDKVNLKNIQEATGPMLNK